jgi:hypothetical protein
MVQVTIMVDTTGKDGLRLLISVFTAPASALQFLYSLVPLQACKPQGRWSHPKSKLRRHVLSSRIILKRCRCPCNVLDAETCNNSEPEPPRRMYFRPPPGIVSSLREAIVVPPVVVDSETDATGSAAGLPASDVSSSRTPYLRTWDQHFRH